MKNSIWLLVLLPIAQVWAQVDTTQHITRQLRYFNNFMLGVQMEFDNNTANPSFAMLHGISIRDTHAVGLGVGLDLYTYWRTLPVYASFQVNLLNKKNNTFFLQVDAGYSHAWAVDVKTDMVPPEVQGGGMLAIVPGLRLHSDRYVVNLQVGYRFQQLKFNTVNGGMPPWSSWWNPIDYEVKQRINRLVVQVGFGRK